MPRQTNFVTSQPQESFRFEDLDVPKYRESYPEDLDLHPDSEDHKKVVNFILSLAVESASTMAQRHKVWEDLDKKLTVFIDLDESEKELRAADPKKPVSIVVPHCYATREILLTYKVAAFLQSPVFKYEPSPDPDDVLGTILLEESINRDVIKHRLGLDLFSMWSDDITYGVGAVMSTWKRTMGQKTNSFGIPEEVLRYEGNALTSIDPYNMLPDPNFPVHATWDMTYFGFVDRKSFLHWKRMEDQGTEGFFNVAFLQKLGNATSSYYCGGLESSGRYHKTGISQPSESSLSRITDVIWMYADLIPKELGIGKSEQIERWLFGLAGDRILIYARKSNFDHGQIPIAVNCSHMDGHNTLPISLLEVEYPIQHAIDWLWYSHVTNLRKSINNMFVVDPSMVNMHDLVDSKAGLILRLRRGAMGRGMIDKVVQQLKVDDITKNNLGDISFLQETSDRTMGLSDLSRGHIPRRGERVSSREVFHANRNQLGRMEKQALVNGLQGHYTLAEQFASNTVQFSTEERYIALNGRFEELLRREYGFNGQQKFDPRLLNVNYDIIPNDGSILDSSSADVWLQLMQASSQHPELFQKIDFVRAWLHLARLMGAKNPQEFLKKQQNVEVSTRDTGQVEEQARQGRLAPLQEVS